MGLVRQTIDRWLGRGVTYDPLSWGAFQSYFTFNGLQYPFTPAYSLVEDKQEPPEPTFDGYVQWAYRSNGIVFACMTARLLLFSEARFQFRQIRSGRPGDLFGTTALEPLERPWQNATTGDLLGRMIQDTDLAGNFYARSSRRGIQRMRPDWVTIVMGSNSEPDDPAIAIDAEIIGYLYHPGGIIPGNKPIPLLPEEVCHFAPLPDPLARFRGMSWITPIVREIMGDNAATQHKLRFFEKGATPNLAVSLDPAIKGEEFVDWVSKFKDQHPSVVDAYRTLFLGGGANVSVVGSDLKQVDFKSTQGAGETRICAAARVPPIIVGISEGLDAATYSNYGEARRAFADLTMRPLWRNAAGSLATLIQVPSQSELWYDDRDIPFLQEDVKDAADALAVKMTAIRTGVDGGFDPASVVDAVESGDLRRLTHTGKLSVQLQEPGTSPTNGNGATPVPIGTGG